MPKPRRAVKGPFSTDATLKFNAYTILEGAVERGLNYGLRRAFKHVNHEDSAKDPEEQHDRMKECAMLAIMSEIGELMDHGDSD